MHSLNWLNAPQGFIYNVIAFVRCQEYFVCHAESAKRFTHCLKDVQAQLAFLTIHNLMKLITNSLDAMIPNYSVKLLHELNWTYLPVHREHLIKIHFILDLLSNCPMILKVVSWLKCNRYSKISINVHWVYSQIG